MTSSNVSVFWDYTSCPVPANLRGSTVAMNIKDLASKYGQVTDFKLYMNETANGSEPTFAEIAKCGVSLIARTLATESAPSVKLVSDLLVYAIDVQKEPNTIIVLVSGDAQHTYPLSMLHRRGFKIVLITSRTDVSAQTLQLQASHIHDWAPEILRIPGTRRD